MSLPENLDPATLRFAADELVATYTGDQDTLIASSEKLRHIADTIEKQREDSACLYSLPNKCTPGQIRRGDCCTNCEATDA